MQTIFLDINPITFYTQCSCHSQNLVLCDMINSFFRVLQCIHNLTLKSLSKTC